MIDRVLDWERLRTFGRLPLFGASYSALILIPTFLFAFAVYNDKVLLAREWARRTIAADERGPIDTQQLRLAQVIDQRLHPRSVPSQSLLILTSTVLLAVASTIYLVFCPSRVKEFSRDQWCDQIGRPLIHYWPLCWTHPVLRVVCFVCYCVGAALAIWVLVVKVCRAGGYIWQHSTFSWT